MSQVTNLILSFSVGEKEEVMIKEVNSFLSFGKEINLVSMDFQGDAKFRWYGGSKFLEANLYVGAFNNFDLEGFFNHLKKIKWDEPELVQLILKEEFDDRFKIIDLNYIDKEHLK